MTQQPAEIYFWGASTIYISMKINTNITICTFSFTITVIFATTTRILREECVQGFSVLVLSTNYPANLGAFQLG